MNICADENEHAVELYSTKSLYLEHDELRCHADKLTGNSLCGNLCASSTADLRIALKS